jgi:hypothetical protein
VDDGVDFNHGNLRGQVGDKATDSSGSAGAHAVTLYTRGVPLQWHHCGLWCGFQPRQLAGTGG